MEDDERVVCVDRGRALTAAVDCVFVSTSQLARHSQILLKPQNYIHQA